MISCILLAAGLSTRFESVKSLVKIQNETLIERLQNQLLSIKIDEMIIVLGAHSDQIRPFILEHKKIRVVYNKDYNFGQTSSFQKGLADLTPEMDGALLLPVDYPAIQPLTINTIIEQFKKNRPHILIPTFNGHRGHPPIFNNKLIPELLGLNPKQQGINSIFDNHKLEINYIEVPDPGILETFNTLKEWESIKIKCKF